MSAAASVARAQQALHLARRARIVRHARLAPAREEDAAQMRFALEDALNTADFGDCGRLIVVRRLRLQALPRGASPALMSRALETAWRALALRALPAEAPQADAAEAVFFSSRLQARLDWLQRVATRADTGAWYWPAALPELKQAASAGDMRASLEVVIEALAQEGWGETVRALGVWPDATIAALARQLPVYSNRRLLDLLTASVAQGVVPPAEAASRAAAARQTDTRSLPVARRLAAQAPLSESAAAWLAALWLAPAIGGAPTTLQAQAVVTRSERLATAADADEDRLSRSGFAAELALRIAGNCDQAPGARETPEQAGASPRASAETPSTALAAVGATPLAVWRMESGLQHAQRSVSQQRARRNEAPLALPWLSDAAETAHGGLLFLVNLLQALRFSRWLDRQAAAVRLPFVDALFTHALKAGRPPRDDPQFAWFAPSGYDAAILSAARFIDGAIAMDSARAVRGWYLRMRRTLRRHAGMDLQDVVRRPAWVDGTATHLDVVFPLAEVDLRLRRRGLDSDPGWVPWFGRIVAFHFVDSELLPQRAAGAEDGDG